MNENCEPYYLLHRIKVLESSYNEMSKFIDELFEEIEQLKKGTESVLYDKEHPADTMMFRNQEEDEEP